MEFKLLAALVSLLAALLAASLAPGAQTTATAATALKTTYVDVSMYEMGFRLSKRVVPRGVVVFRVVNDGQAEHDFRIRGRGTALLAAGERATLRVRFDKAGRFTYVCTVEGHAAAGMIGKLVVK